VNSMGIYTESNPYQVEVEGKYSDFLKEDENNGFADDDAAAYNSHGVIKEQKRCVNVNLRLVLCVLAIGLLWGSSYALATGFVDLIFGSPSAEEVQEEVKYLSAVVSAESSAYESCIGINSRDCNRTLYEILAVTAREYAAIYVENEEKVNSTSALSYQCSQLKNQTIVGLTNYVNAMPPDGLLNYFRPQCSKADRGFLTKFLEDPELQENNAVNSVGIYTGNNIRMLTEASDQAKIATNYSETYLSDKEANVSSYLDDVVGSVQVPNISFTALDGLNDDYGKYMACITITETDECDNANSVRAKTMAAYDEMQQDLKALEDRLEANRKKMREVANEIETAKVEFEATKTHLSEVSASLGQVAGVGGDIDLLPDDWAGSFTPDNPFDTFGTQISSLNAPDMNLPELSLNLSQIQQNVQGTVDDSTQAVSISVEDAKDTANVAADEWKNDVTGKLNDVRNRSVNLAEDYDPHPPVNPNLTQVEDANTELETKAKTHLADVNRKLEVQSTKVYNSVSRTLVNVQSSGYGLSDLKYKEPSSDVDIAGWDYVWNIIKWSLYSLDAIFRIYWSCRIFIRYWNGSAAEVPSMDIRRFKTTVKRGMVERYFAFVTHPAVLFSGTIVLATLIIIAVVSLYVPMVNSYVEGCVESDAGTFLSNNTYSAIYNGAGYTGNKDIVNYLKDYDQTRAQGCATIVEETVEAYLDSTAQMELVRSTFGKSYDVLSLIEKCIDPSIWKDSDVLRSSPGAAPIEIYQELTKFAEFTDLSITNECKLAKLEEYELDNSTLNCSESVRTCSYGCPGPHKYTLKQASSKSVCYGEFFLHSFILRIFCTVLVYIFWNISRMMLMSGIVMLHWRPLTPKGFEYLGTCDRDGNLLEDSERELKETIPKVIKAFERKARLTIVAAVAINLVYIVALATLANEIAYPGVSGT